MATYQEIQTDPGDYYNPRTEENLKPDLLDCKKYHPFHDKENPLFNIFDLITFDVMHDCMEGVIKNITKIILKDLNIRFNLTKKVMQERVNSMHFGTGRVDISNEFDIHGTADQKNTFFCSLPRVFENEWKSCDKTHQLWSVYRNIMTLMLSDFIEEIWLTEFDINVRNFYTLYLYFVKKYKVTVTPKIHYLSHVSYYIRRHGPPSLYSSMRFERKHLDLSTIIKSTNCFKNPSYTMAYRHQEKQVVSNYPASIIRDFEKFGTKCILSLNLNENYRNLLPKIEDIHKIFKLDSVTYSGIVLKIQKYYIIGCDKQNNPYFVYILDIFEINDEIYIIVQKYRSNFINYLYSYKLTNTEQDVFLLDKNEIINSRSYESFLIKKNEYIIKHQKISKKFKVFQLI